MSKLIVISNRVAIPNGKAEAGGLAVALQEALKKNGGIWCGSSGDIREYPKVSMKSENNISYITRDYTRSEYRDFYLGFSNSVLWPLFHYCMSNTSYTQEMFQGYEEVNKIYAEIVAKNSLPDDIIWVHDYHFLLLGQHLRYQGVKNKTGFFLHIPFPAPEVFTALPVHQEILKGMSCYDLVGFQTDSDLKSFIRCMTELAGGKIIGSANDKIVEIEAFGRHFKAGNFPISIDTLDMEKAAEAAEKTDEAISLKKSLNNRKLIIGVDRLDYTKGLLSRLQAYNNFLKSYPDQCGKVSYIQITPPSRTDVEEYQDLREEIEKLATNINGSKSTIDWVPIRYVNKTYSRNSLAGFYRLAEVGLVTPIRDGMNLVAKEYVASQDPNNPGVLILSQFAGAANELDAALIVNPYDTETMAQRIKQALIMPLAERKERHAAMLKVLRQNTIFTWTDSFLNSLKQAGKPESRVIASSQISYFREHQQFTL